MTQDELKQSEAKHAASWGKSTPFLLSEYAQLYPIEDESHFLFDLTAA